ncbi:hypothetical protein BCR42DRAFT_384555 [Absidia repens]|uniref:DUF8032 domain-containing protein n=1 Tax=Absidia repens TaxID=90262 RepID=A0A1X2HYI1_9FUNG|nr:hypothetical protein BCR42DRAFT_384555 [Absidia repens]
MNLLPLSASTLTGAVGLPASSCYFETLHKHVPTSGNNNSIEDLMTSPEQMEPTFERLTLDQLHNIEQALRKVKKRKTRQQAAAAAAAAALDASSPSGHKKQKLDTDNNKDGQQSQMHPASVNTTTTQNSHNRTVIGPPAIEMRDGVEWVSFVYSHNRVLQRHAIRTDIDDICLESIDEEFQLDNCVYPRANVPKETYQGNRWNYETQCNVLGWKLAWINKEIVGKRGLIQRAVDSYRNRNPTMRSRRVARQTKMLNGTLRKRKSIFPSPPAAASSDNGTANDDSVVSSFPLPCATSIPKTMTMEDELHVRFRVKITLDQVDLNDIDPSFRAANCVYPRAMAVESRENPFLQQKWVEENTCNELGWKMAWLNPRLINKRTLLQRALDLYRLKFMPSLAPRQKSSRTAPKPPPPLAFSDMDQSLTRESNNGLMPHHPTAPFSPSLSCTTDTTESLDFGECLSLDDDDDADMMDGCDLASINTSLTASSFGNDDNTTMICTPTSSPLDGSSSAAQLNKLLLDDHHHHHPAVCSSLCGGANLCLFGNSDVVSPPPLFPSFSSPVVDASTGPMDDFALLPSVMQMNPTNNQSQPLLNELPSSAMMDFTKTYDNGLFDHDLLFKMEETADDLFDFL